jgi:predicted transcriptional regulator of viral defense system
MAALARRQHGVLSLRQLGDIGLSASGVRNRVASGRLHRVHRGVYAVGHPLLTRDGRLMAAVLACGGGTALSHRSAAAHRGLRADGRNAIDVISQRRPGRRIGGIAAHTSATLLARDVELVGAVPTTTLARTLLDLADVVTPRQLERAVEQAEVLRALDMRAITDVLTRADGRRGAATLRAVLSEMRLGTTTTRNDLEEAFLEICRDAGTPPDGVNVWIPYPDGGGAEADFVWQRHNLIAEVDGRATHLTPRAFEHDRRRDQRLAALGWRVVRFSWRQVATEPDGVAATVSALHAAQRP